MALWTVGSAVTESGGGATLTKDATNGWFPNSTAKTIANYAKAGNTLTHSALRNASDYHVFGWGDATAAPAGNGYDDVQYGWFIDVGGGTAQWRETGVAGPTFAAAAADLLEVVIVNGIAKGYIAGILKVTSGIPVVATNCKGVVVIFGANAFHTVVTLNAVPLFNPTNDGSWIALL